MTSTHFHIATGLAGYGPDGSDGFGTATDVASLTYAITEELSHAIDYNAQNATGEAELGDYKAAWMAHELAESLDTLARNLDYARRSKAPLYVDNAAALDASMMATIESTFPLDITYNTRLYVWECDAGAGCEHADNDAA